MFTIDYVELYLVNHIEVANQKSRFTRRESNFGANNMSFEIIFKGN